MTKEILATDVELARGMFDEDRREEEIRASLVARGLDFSTAATILDDLHHNRMTHTETAFLLGVRVAHVRGHQPLNPTTMRQRSEASTNYPRQLKAKRIGTWPFAFVFIVFAWAFGYAYLHLGKNASAPRVETERQELATR
jgi:hypothetical protein